MFGLGMFGGGGGGTSISPDNSMHNDSAISGQFGDVNLGFGAGNKNTLLIIAGAAVLIVAILFIGKR